MENAIPAEQPGLIPGSPPPRHVSEENKIMPPYHQVPDTYSQAGTYYTAPPTIIEKERRICGLRVITFALLLALIVVIIAAAVGGGVGGALAVNNAKTSCLNDAAYAAGVASQVRASNSAAATAVTTSLSTSTATPTNASGTASATSSSFASTATTIWGPKATSLPFTGCPDNDNKVYNAATNGAKFQMICGQDIPNTGHSDLLNAIVPTFELCMELCASWNDIGKSNGNATIPCKGVAFIPTHVNGDGSGAPIDCVLKSISTGLAPNPGYDVDSGLLLTT